MMKFAKINRLNVDVTDNPFEGSERNGNSKRENKSKHRGKVGMSAVREVFLRRIFSGKVTVKIEMK
jgi:hypothetical protein